MLSDLGYVVAVNGISAIRDLETIPESIKVAAQQAVNRTSDRARTASAKEILQQVAFPASYLAPSGGRLSVTKRATRDDLEARITGRWRPTSLARFVRSGSPGNTKSGVSLEVQPGHAVRSKRMFLLRLRAGTADLDTQSNLGLAIRLKPGERVEGKHKMVQLSKGLYLLYGPAIVAGICDGSQDISPDAADFMQQEFLRLLEVHS
jgi:hypothetical protein